MSEVQHEATPENQWENQLASMLDDVAVTKEALLTVLDNFLDQLEKEEREEEEEEVSLPQPAATRHPRQRVELVALMVGFKHKLNHQMGRVEDMLRQLSQHALEGPILLNDATHKLRAGQDVLRTIMEDYQEIHGRIHHLSSCVCAPYPWGFMLLPLLTHRIRCMLPWLSAKMDVLIREMLASVKPPYKICQGSVCHCGLFPAGIPASMQEEPSRAKRRKGGASSDEMPCKCLDMRQLADHGDRGSIYIRRCLGESYLLH